MLALGALLWLKPATREAEHVAASTTTSIPLTTTTSERRATRVWPPEQHAIEGNGARWTWESSPDDWALMGAWACDAELMPALVQRTTGAVWVIDRWPEGEEVSGRYVATVAGVTRATVAREAGCDVIVLTTDDGREVRVTPV